MKASTPSKSSRRADSLFAASFDIRLAAKEEPALEALADDVHKAAVWYAERHHHSCECCTHHLGGVCDLAEKKIPAKVLHVGCPEFEYQFIPF